MSDDLLTPTTGRVTLAVIADQAAVSVSTVSKVLNGKGGVSDPVRARIEELLHEHGYNRRMPAEPERPLIELVFYEMETPGVYEVIKGAEHVARANGLGLIVTQSGTRVHPDDRWISDVVRRKPIGVVLNCSDLTASQKKQLRTRNIPFVVLDPAGSPAPDVPSIGSANWSGGLLATQHLIELGHRDIGIITGPAEMMCSQARISGYRSALEAAAIPFRPEYLVPGEFLQKDGIAGGTALLSLPNPPTAIFAGSDLQALGVYEAARSKGLSIPDDLSVVGYDDLPLAEWAGPPMTTIRQPIVEMAEQATSLVLRLSTGSAPERVRVELATDLIVRSSTKRFSG
ncbi:LacI family DNA-binding transcriptional regulator [Frondihabitans australicus]|uniref:LacI family transcriptional regulator n=1 Tax=Frondihabitans australicus TaxID=386892 RepID=A0A495IKD3_9MICO|nr:LacI family DNA-binding transcriptional regulator [Frondihabitans australicus]RKR76427.1 LacI family transcriptional regulator [Frondihabitans australicus]